MGPTNTFIMKELKFKVNFDFIQIGGKAIDKIGREVGEVIRIKSPYVYLEINPDKIVKRHRLDVSSYKYTDN